jgi:hypothetical protein
MSGALRGKQSAVVATFDIAFQDTRRPVFRYGFFQVVVPLLFVIKPHDCTDIGIVCSPLLLIKLQS